jgi:uncharacterized membrane protein
MNPSGRTKAIIAYLTFIGMLIAYSMNRDQRDPFATWHIKNMFGLVLGQFIFLMLDSYLNDLVHGLVFGALFLAWLISIIMALTNQKKGIPVLSEKFQQWFTFLN